MSDICDELMNYDTCNDDIVDQAADTIRQLRSLVYAALVDIAWGTDMDAADMRTLAQYVLGDEGKED